MIPVFQEHFDYCTVFFSTGADLQYCWKWNPQKVTQFDSIMNTAGTDYYGSAHIAHVRKAPSELKLLFQSKTKPIIFSNMSFYW